MKRVVVTGLGVVSPIGCSRETFWNGLVEGRTGVKPIAHIPTGRLDIKIAAYASDFDAESFIDPRRLSQMDRFAQMAIFSARSAVVDSGVDLRGELAQTTAIIVGTGMGGATTLDNSYQRLYGENASRVHPLTVPRLMVNAGASHVAMDLEVTGPTFAVASACSSGTHAVGLAFQMVRGGMVPLALAGGAEACLTVGGLKAWEALRVLSPEACRPFSKNRSGLVLGEGAAMLVLEERERAVARGAAIYAEILGFGMGADAGDLTSPSVEGMARTMRQALADAGCNVDDIDYINAHGTGTLINDASETRAIRDVFGAHADRLAISSNKAVLGHGLGAAGALEAVATALTLQRQILPPTAGYQIPDPQCDLDVVPNVARSQTVRVALSNSFAFGGLNAVLAFGRN
jgi:nodulation protein E